MPISQLRLEFQEQLIRIKLFRAEKIEIEGTSMVQVQREGGAAWTICQKFVRESTESKISYGKA